MAVSGQIEIGNNACEGEIGENLLALPPVEVVGSSCRGFRNDGVRQADGDGNEAARIRIGKVTDENAIGDGKDAGGRRASKAEDQDGEYSEPRRLQKSTDRLAKLRSHEPY